MDLEILHINECPNWEEAGRRVRDSLLAMGRGDKPIRFRLIESPEDAAKTAFAGSPTITADGTDLFPSEGATSELACRIYYTPSGLAGLPTVDQLIGRIQARER